MMPVISSPYRVPPLLRRRASRALTKGVRPLFLNALVLGSAFALILGCNVIWLGGLTAMIVARLGGSLPAFVAAALVTFGLPWLAVALIWRRVWFRIVSARLAALSPPEADIVFTLDEDGVSVDEAGASHALTWASISRVLVVGGAVVVARGGFCLVAPLEAIGGRSRLALFAARLSPDALAASSEELRHAAV